MTLFKQTIREGTVNPQGAFKSEGVFFCENEHDAKDAQWVLVIVLSMYRYIDVYSTLSPIMKIKWKMMFKPSQCSLCKGSEGHSTTPKSTASVEDQKHQPTSGIECHLPTNHVSIFHIYISEIFG